METRRGMVGGEACKQVEGSGLSTFTCCFLCRRLE